MTLMGKTGQEKLVKAIYQYWPEGVVVLGLGLAAIGLGSIFQPNNSSEIEIIPAQKQEKAQEIVIDIAGAVVKPGVYTLPSNSRLNDLLIACGGLSEEADRNWVDKNLNRAAALIDGAKIYIPAQSEEMGTVSGAKTGDLPASSADLVNLNQADSLLLETLPGIGPVTAKKIIDYREVQGGFKSLEELMAVPGIGKKTFENLRELITVY
ncbi:ComEA family DNA-binding protein [Candidatus Shapirobacteria bacterium]|nr:ComEA family DNA-binding protein [Candidatus Shapirobacteria bacterium]